MGKKGKGKDDKAPAEDVFDPLAVETKNAQTAILMLDSPEEEIQAKACEGLYKFAYKCDENKKVLLDAGALDGLVKLLSTDDRTIRRNALMALGTMTFHPDVRKQLRATGEVIPLLVKLLNPEEFATTHEFATLALCNMAKEFASIAAILKHKGLEHLLECLKEDDPDVQKNAAECISLLLQDYEAKASIKDSSGLESLLELLESEYAVIQELALQSLIRATQDSSNRAALRELEALGVFVNIIGKPECNDLHVHALHVLANCADDIESLVQLKETGALLRFVAFITDETPPPEEQKDSGKGKGKGKGSAKKKKGDEDKKEAESVPSHTLPEVKMHAARAIGRAARTDDGKRVLHDCDAEKMLVLLLAHEDDKVRVAAAQAIAVMGESFVCQEAVVKHEGLETLVKFAKLENKDIKESSSLAIANLTSGNMQICQSVASISHGVDSLIGCLGNDNERIAANGLTALINMAADDALRHKVLHAGLINALQHPLASKSELVEQKAAAAVASFICEPAPRAEFRNSRNLALLVPLLLSNSDAVRRSTSWAICVLAADYETAVEIYRQEGLKILQEINDSETKRNKFSELAMQKLLDNNVSLKYALLGSLTVVDRIPDVFYDAGQLRPDAQLPPLEDLCSERVNTKRPVLLINATEPEPPPELASASAATDDTDERRSTPLAEGARTPTGRRAKSSRDSPKGSRRHQAAAPAAADNQLAVANGDASNGDAAGGESAETEAPFAPPLDAALRHSVEEARRIVAQCTNQREELLQLASLVSDRMGGAVARSQLMQFSYELSMSQLKFSLKSNVVPIGLVNAGVHYHRALLFKFLADRCGINCSLNRGSYNRAWNSVWLADSDGQRTYPPSEYVVDLIFDPGSLYRHDSIEAANYKKI